MTNKKEIDEYMAARKAEEDHQSKIDDIGDSIASYSAQIDQAKKSGDTELAEELLAKVLEASAKRREMKSRIR